MTMNGKRDHFTREDFRVCAKAALMKRGRADAILDEVIDAVKQWPQFAEAASVSDHWCAQIQQAHRLVLPAE